MINLTIPLTQTAAQFTELNGPISIIKDHPVVQQKDLKPGTALVNVIYTGVCHTDLHALKG